MKLKEIIYKEEAISYDADENTEILSISTNPEDVIEGSLLIITRNEEILLKFEKIAPSAVVCGQKVILPDNIPAIRLENPRIELSNAYYRFEKVDLDSCILIGITGTNGKSSTAKFISHTLSSLGHKVGLIGTGAISIGGEIITDDRYSMTTPDPSLLYPTLAKMINDGCGVIVMEVSSHALALDKVYPLKFDYGLFTNLSDEHMDFHKDRSSYLNAKKKLLDASKCAIINIDDPCGRILANEFRDNSISTGVIYRGDVYATNIERLGMDGINYTYHGSNFSFKMRLATPGIFNVYNSMMAAAVCIDIGEKPCRVKQSIGLISEIPGRFRTYKSDISVVIDYAHTDFAFHSILKELYDIKKGNLTVIFGCGGNRDRSKRPRMAEVAEKFCDKIIITTDNPRSEDPKQIIDDVIKGFKESKHITNEDRKESIRSAILEAKPGEIIAILGKGIEKYMITESGYASYDEEKIVKDALKERKDRRSCE